MGDTEEFNTLTFEKRLMQLKDTQESIQALSSWCLKQRAHHKRIVSSWLNVLKRVKVEQRLVLFYLANDVIQYSKRKNYEFVESWGLNLQKATPLVRDDKVRPKILRIFKIWEQRSVYDEEFLTDLTGLLSAGAVKKTDDDPLDFQPQQLVNKIKQCQVLESDTDLRLKFIHESHLDMSDADALCANLKDRSTKDDVEKELNEGIGCVERYTQALQREIVAREALLALLTSAQQYYSTQKGEVKVVAYAYKNFGARVRVLKRKLDSLTPSLPPAPSPPRDEDVPSPGPDEDIDLPAPGNDDDDIAYNIDRTFNTSLAPDGSLYNMGLSSFLASENPMALFNENLDNLNNANKIEVINNRPDEKKDFNISDFFKNIVTSDFVNACTSDNTSVASGTMSQKSQDALPGLDLLTPESTGNPPPPTSFYGTMEQINDEPEHPYIPEPANTWNANNWTLPAPPAPPLVCGLDTPESPPPAPLRYMEHAHQHQPIQEPPPADVDHRGILPPPPPPPVLPLLGHIEDVDHRLLPSLIPPPIPNAAPLRHPGHQDVDHRNLIPLTHQPPVPIHPLPMTRPMNPISLDQDYRVPTMVPPVITPSDIVESVDMDLSEDEDQQGMYQPDHQRRPSFNNNKVLVGGDNGKTQHDKKFIHNHTENNYIHDKKEPLSAPIIQQMVNPFEAMPMQRMNSYNDIQDKEYEDDIRENDRHPSPDFEHPPPDYDHDWQNRPRPMMNRGRGWSPRTFRPQAQFWPRPTRGQNRWMAPRPQRFW